MAGLTDAKEDLAKTRAVLENMRRIEESLAREMLASEQRLSTHQIRLRETRAAVLVASAEFTDLLG